MTYQRQLRKMTHLASNSHASNEKVGLGSYDQERALRAWSPSHDLLIAVSAQAC
jgi:hypothetical protein